MSSCCTACAKLMRIYVLKTHRGQETEAPVWNTQGWSVGAFTPALRLRLILSIFICCSFILPLHCMSVGRAVLFQFSTCIYNPDVVLWLLIIKHCPVGASSHVWDMCEVRNLPSEYLIFLGWRDVKLSITPTQICIEIYIYSLGKYLTKSVP